MKVLTGTELLEKIAKKEDISDIWVCDTTDLKGGVNRYPGKYYTLLPAKEHLKVSDIYAPHLLIVEIPKGNVLKALIDQEARKGDAAHD